MVELTIVEEAIAVEEMVEEVTANEIARRGIIKIKKRLSSTMGRSFNTIQATISLMMKFEI